MRSLSCALVAIAALALAPAAFAQQALLQAGPWTSAHVPMYSGPSGNFGQPILQDSGPASGGGAGVGLSELGLTVQGTGTPPYANAGTGPYGSNMCDYDAPITNATGYHYICLSPNAQGGESIIAGNGGAASPLPLQFVINGTVVPINTVVSGNLLDGLQNGAIVPLVDTTYALPVPVWSSYTTQFAPAIFNLGGLPATAFFGGLGTPGGYTSGGVTQALLGVVDTPSTDQALLQPGSISGNVNVGVVGVCRTASTVKGCVGGAFLGETNANGASSFGLSINATNFPYGNGTATGFNAATVVGMDLTIPLNAPATGVPATVAEGIRIFGALGSGAIAPSQFIGIEIGGTGNSTIGWGSAIFIDPSPNTAAISISQAGSASTQASQSINFSNKVSGTVYQAVLYEDQFANFVVNAQAGELINVGGATAFQISSGISTPTVDGFVSDTLNSAKTALNVYSGLVPGGYAYWDASRSVVDLESGTTITNGDVFGAYCYDNVAAIGGANNAACVGYFGVMVAVANSAQVWGSNLTFSDSLTTSVSAGTGKKLIGNEYDFTDTSPSTIVEGFSVILQGPSTPASGNGFQVGINSSTALWTNAYVSNAGAATTALNVGSLNATATANGPSQLIAFQAFNSGSTGYTAKLQVVADTLNFTDTEEACGVALTSGSGGSTVHPAGCANGNLSLASAGSGAVFVQSPLVLLGVLELTQATWTDTQTCTAGQMTADANFIYACTATNTVKRAALSTF